MLNKILLIIVFCAFFSTSVLGQAYPYLGPMLHIELLGTELKERSDVYSIEAKLHLTITNKTNQKILLLDKYSWVWEKNIYRKEADGTLTRLNSVSSGISYSQRDQARKELLGLELPSEKLRELDPGEEFAFNESSYILIDKAKDSLRGEPLFMEALQGVSSVWLSLQYIYWDPNLDLDLKTMKKLNFADQLRKKWSGYGALWTEPMKSNLIEIPLPKFDYQI